jgi:predicted RNase H-like nuclease (RuvC/YqgF family)
MRNKISDIEKSMIYYQTNSIYLQKEKKSSSPNRSNFNTYDNSQSKFNSQDANNNTDKNYNYEYKEKSQNSALNNLEPENKRLKEDLKSRDKIIISLENQIRELLVLNKTCYDLLGQLNN